MAKPHYLLSITLSYLLGKWPDGKKCRAKCAVFAR